MLKFSKQGFCFDINKTALLDIINLKQLIPLVTIPKNLVKQSKVKCSSVLKKLLKLIRKESEEHINQKSNHFLAKIKIYSLNLQHILCPFYKVRFHKPGFDVEYLINANSKKCREK